MTYFRGGTNLHLKLRSRFAWWPVELWGHDAQGRGVEFKGVYLWRKNVIELKTVHGNWVAYEQYQDLKPGGG